MILMMAKYREILLLDSPLSSLSVNKLLSSLETKMILITPNETFLRITRYLLSNVNTSQREDRLQVLMQ